MRAIVSVFSFENRVHRSLLVIDCCRCRQFFWNYSILLLLGHYHHSLSSYRRFRRQCFSVAHWTKP